MSEQKRLRAIRAYETYLSSIRYSHEQSFIRNDSDIGNTSRDIQLSMHAEIEIVEDIIQQLNSKRYKSLK